MLQLFWSLTTLWSLMLSKSKNQGLSCLWNLYDDISKVQQKCVRFEVVKIGRQSNKATHLLAAAARYSGQNHYWMGNVPPDVADQGHSGNIF